MGVDQRPATSMDEKCPGNNATEYLYELFFHTNTDVQTSTPHEHEHAVSSRHRTMTATSYESAEYTKERIGSSVEAGRTWRG